nr:unnamed protein product [Callosobruchus chinensis]
MDWPPRSPDLNLMDFYLWEDMKHRVNSQEDHTKEELLYHIDSAAMEIRNNVRTLCGACSELRRARLCVERSGDNFEHLFTDSDDDVFMGSSGSAIVPDIIFILLEATANL